MDVDVDLVECLVLDAPVLGALARVAHELAELVRTSTVRIVDLACVTRNSDARLVTRELEEVSSLSPLLHVEVRRATVHRVNGARSVNPDLLTHLPAGASPFGRDWMALVVDQVAPGRAGGAARTRSHLQ